MLNRAKNLIRKLKKYIPAFENIETFSRLSTDYVFDAIAWAKKKFHLRNIGPKTIKDVLDFHKTMKDLWG